MKDAVLSLKTNQEGWKGGGRRGYFLLTSQKPSCCNPSWLKDVRATREDTESDQIWAKQGDWPETTPKLTPLP